MSEDIRTDDSPSPAPSLNWAGGDNDFTAGPLLEYVLGRPADTDQPVLGFHDGTAKIYDLGVVSIYGSGAMAFQGGSAFLFALLPYGAFDDFAIFPETGTDPVSGLLIANNSGTSTAGVGDPWSRHYLVVVPPKKTRFAVPHIKLAALAANTSQYLDAHQLEILTPGSTTPGAFVSARSIKPTVRPTRLNYYAGSLTVTNLIPGLTYTASATVAGKRESFQFVPTSSSKTLSFSGSATKVLVEEGTVLGDYFDGDSGDDYLWETGGTRGSARSYYYPDRANRHAILVRTLEENVALGMTVLDPVYATLPPPSSTS